MGDALQWINQIAEWVGRLIPKWTVVPATHAGVKFVRGKRVVAFGAGIQIWWPAATEIKTYPVVRQAVDLRTQTCVTVDDKVIAVGGLIVYRISDIKAILGQTFDPDNTIKDICAGAIHDVCAAYTWEAMREIHFTKELRRTMQKRLRPYGVHVMRATITDLAPCRVLRLVQSTASDVG